MVVHASTPTIHFVVVLIFVGKLRSIAGIGELFVGKLRSSAGIGYLFVGKLRSIAGIGELFVGKLRSVAAITEMSSSSPFLSASSWASSADLSPVYFL